MNRLFVALMLCMPLMGWAQSHTQSIRGRVIDQESHQPLIGANVFIEKTIPLLGTTTDLDGEFEILDVPVGRHTIVVSYLGYNPAVISQVLVISGKELIIDIDLEESAVKLEEAVVYARTDKTEALNEMAVVSARSFSVEETGRYASSLFDPARMAANFAGVSVTGGSSDLFNEIVVRGNSPRGVLWRLEGIEIPNPNHFGALGNTGGGISMLSSSTLSSSDFYTGAFPAEFGNASSGVFDLNLRKGNNRTREYSFMVGLLGIEAALEGPFSKNSDASYLVNFRYSTLSALKAIGANPVGDVLPEYGDVSFNFNVPTKKAGTFSLFGLGGANKAYHQPEADSLVWEESTEGNDGFNDRQKMGVIGLTHKYFTTKNSFLRTVVSGSIEQYRGDGYHLVAEDDYRVQTDYKDNFNDYTFRVSSTYTHKLSARQTLRAGGILSYKTFNFFNQEYDEDLEDMVTYIENEGDATELQLFAQWKYRMCDDLSVTGGLHYTYFGLNKNASIEPRAAVQWDVAENQSLKFAAGLHSKPEHPVFYYTGGENVSGVPGTPNFDLDYTKSFHAVAGYTIRLTKDLRINAEAYYQYLYDVPVQIDYTEVGSMLNVIDIWDAAFAGPAINEGKGRNIGIDLTVEKSYSRGYYVLVTGSVFDSKYRSRAGDWYNTRFSSKYQTNLLGGKEWTVGKAKNNVIGLNLKFIINGGERTTPIDIMASEKQGETVRFVDQQFSESIGTYYRVDMGASFKINKPKLTHTISIDLQNATGRMNPFYNYYSTDTGNIEYAYHTGLFPVLNYRIEF